MLLTRDQFRNQVFQRDNDKCVICGEKAQDAHHIMERRLFEDGGYYLNNGASLCGTDHILAEKTLLTCEVIREAAKITEIVLPPHLYRDAVYDKWGNIILDNGTRLKGELYNDESVFKILEEVRGQFTNRVKFPRTYHLPWSPGRKEKNERTHTGVNIFEGRDVVVTTKMDGENTTIYNDYCHARSLDSEKSPSISYIRGLAPKFQYLIPENWRICGENLYIKHSIGYDNLPDYFLVFSIWNDKNYCLSWDETVEYSQLLGLKTVDILYRGVYNKDLEKLKNAEGHEGYVLRLADGFHYKDYRKYVAKYVRDGHVQTSHHWKYSVQERNICTK